MTNKCECRQCDSPSVWGSNGGCGSVDLQIITYNSEGEEI